MLIFSLLIGFLSGCVAALCGVGGGVLLVPIFAKFFKLSWQSAIATSLLVIIPTAISATISNSQKAENPLIAWRIGIPIAIGAVIAAYFASDLMRSLSTQSLTRIFAVLLILTGARILFTSL